MSGHPAAVVVGGDLNGLGVVRSLARAGISTFVLDTDLSKPTMRTRFGRKRRIGALSGNGLIESLLQLRETLDADPVLFLTQEASVATVSAACEHLAASYRFRMAPHNVMQALLDKVLFQNMAEAGGFPIPKSVHLFRSENGEAAVAGLRFPCVLKPTTKHPEYGKRFQKAYRLESAADVEPLWSQMRDVVDEMIVQEWIEGDDTDVYFCLQYRADAERAAASFVGRKLHQWPPLVGGTAFCMAAPEVAEELSACTDAFFRHGGFQGMGSMEFKRDRRDGTFYMIEPTVGRTDYQEEIATLNGMNIPAIAYHVETGKALPLALTKDIHSHGWRDPLGYANARKAGVPDAIGQFAQDVKVWDAYFRPEDPMPAMALKAHGLLRRIKRKAI
jgi:predicted ATP-grasp superfamily ATP-dependent carboligase